MSKDFPKVRIGDIAVVKGGKRLPKGHSFLYETTQHPYIQGQDIRHGRIKISKPVFISEETHTKIARYIVRAGDLCVTIVGNIGDVGMVPPSLDGANLTENAAKLAELSHHFDATFVMYALLDTDAQLQMKNYAAGAAQPKLGFYKLEAIEIPQAPLPTQRKIAGVLSAYDDLIENNTRRIAILEEMAQAIYREWFVNFRYPGHENVKLINSPVGKIPEGWKATSLGDTVELAYGKALKADDRKPGPFPVYGSGGVVGFHDEAYKKGPGIIVGRKGNVGSVFWSDVDFYPIDTVFFVITKAPLHYVYYNLVLSQSFLNSDAAVPGLNRNQAYRNPFLLPSHDVMTLFEDHCSSLFSALQNLRKRNDNLRTTRDLLLPKLINGQLNVEEITIDTVKPMLEDRQ
jgi:type I restriction enzyme S subunit